MRCVRWTSWSSLVGAASTLIDAASRARRALAHTTSPHPANEGCPFLYIAINGDGFQALAAGRRKPRSRQAGGGDKVDRRSVRLPRIRRAELNSAGPGASGKAASAKDGASRQYLCLDRWECRAVGRDASRTCGSSVLVRLVGAAIDEKPKKFCVC